MAARDEIIRLLMDVEGTKEADKLLAVLREVEQQGGETGEAAGKLAADFEKLATVDQAASSFVKLKAALADTDQRIEQAKTGLAALNAEFSESDRSSGVVSKQYARAEKELARLVDQYHRQQVEMQRVSGTLAKAGVDTDKLANAQRNARARMVDVTTQARALATGMRNAGDATERAGRQAERSGGAFTQLRGLIAPLLAMLGFRAAAEGVANLFNLGNAAERLERQFSRMYGGAGEGKAALDEIRQLAAETGTDFDTLASTAAKLKNFGIEPLDGALQSLVDQNAAVAGTQEDLEGKILAVGQAWAKQKLQGEEILQLVERGVPVWRLLEEATGKNVTELQKLSEAGRLGRNEIKLLIDQIGKENAGAASDSVLGDLTAQTTLLRNEIQKLGEDLTRGDALGTAAESIGKLTERLRELAQSPEFERLRQAIEKATTAGGQALDQILASDKIPLVVSQIATITEGVANLTRVATNVGGAVSDGVLNAVKPYLLLNDMWGVLLEKGAEVTDQWRKHREEMEKAAPAVEPLRDSVAALEADLDRMQISTRTAGEQLVHEARSASAAFIQLATDSNSAGDEILAAFDREILLAKTREEVERLGEGLRVAYEAGKLGADQYADATERAGAVTAGMAGNLDNLARQAAEVWGKLQEAIANGESPAAIAELESQFASLNRQIAAGEQGVLGLNGALGETEGAVFTLDEAFKQLGLKSKASMEAARDAARAAFETIQQGAKDGTAATEDVSRAWEVYAKRVLDVARLSGDATEKQVTQQLRAQAAAEGLTGSLEKLGLVGKKAGDDTAASAKRAAGALQETANAANDASDALESTSASASELATSTQQVQVNLVNVASQAAITSGELGDVSNKFKELLADKDLYQGGGAQLFFDLNRQSSELEKQLQLIEDQNAAYDPLAMKVRDLRAQYTFLGDEQLRRLAQAQMQLDENIAREQEAAAAKRAALLEEKKLQDDLRQSTPTPRNNASGIGVPARLELVVKNEQRPGGILSELSERDLDAIGERLIRQLQFQASSSIRR